MNLGYATKKQPIVLRIGIETKAPQKMILRVRDENKPHTFYTRRFMVVNGRMPQPFRVQMPQSPEKAVIEVFNAKNGNLENGKDKTFRITDFGTEPLKQSLECIDDSPKVKSFIKFLQDFSERAGITVAGFPGSTRSIYHSNDGKFRIDYLTKIVDTDRMYFSRKEQKMKPNPRYGKEVTTPARINSTRGIIEVSKDRFINMTVPMRMAILLHEISHFYLNNVMADEIEADLNALRIYLALGYPLIEANEAFLKTFINAPTDGNVERARILMDFIKNWDNKYKYLCKKK